MTVINSGIVFVEFRRKQNNLVRSIMAAGS
jgi:hypothetical protein